MVLRLRMCPSSPRSSARIVVPVTPCKENSRLAELLGDNYSDHRTYSVAEAWDDLAGKVDLIINDENVSNSRRRQVMKLILELKRAHLKADGMKAPRTENIACLSCPRCTNAPSAETRRRRLPFLGFVANALRVALAIGGGVAIGSRFNSQFSSVAHTDVSAVGQAEEAQNQATSVQMEANKSRRKGEKKVYADRILRRNSTTSAAPETKFM